MSFPAGSPQALAMVSDRLCLLQFLAMNKRAASSPLAPFSDKLESNAVDILHSPAPTHCVRILCALAGLSGTRHSNHTSA